MENKISKQLAAFVVNTRYEDLSPAAIESTKRCLLDGIGVSLAASGIGEGVVAFADVSSMQDSSGKSSLFGFAKKTSAVQAAFVNGAFAHALDFEDAHDETLMHPNAASIPAAIAVSQDLGDVTGKELIAAIAIACDVVCRLASAIDKPLDDFGWYPPPIFNVFGATAAAASLYKLSEQEVLSAFSIALCNASCSAEIKYNPNSVIRAIRDAFPAQMGVLAAQLAKQGIVGFEFPFEGKAGFFNNFVRGHYHPEKVVQGLGRNFRIEQISLKPWPSCRGTHAFIEAAKGLIAEHKIEIDSIEKIICYGCRINRMLAEPIESKRVPKTAIDAKFSIPYVVALAICYGGVKLDHFFVKDFHDQKVIQVSKKVEYRIDPEFDDGPEGMTTARMEICCANGSILKTKVKGAYGNPSRPLSDQNLSDKFMQCCRFVKTPKPDAEFSGLHEALLNLENHDDLNEAVFNKL